MSVEVLIKVAGSRDRPAQLLLLLQSARRVADQIPNNSFTLARRHGRKRLRASKGLLSSCFPLALLPSCLKFPKPPKDTP